ncbi:MAG: carbohydrate ABC transporter permease [Fibrobacteres bacterium]|nr:carbohydrate ABC transporter permease [Fibrobacterota bacterium]
MSRASRTEGGAFQSEGGAWAPLKAALLAAYALISLAPIVYLVLTAFKLPTDAAALPPRFLPGASAPEDSYWFRFTLLNFRRVLADGGTLLYFFNSVFVSVCSTVLSVAAGSLAGYGFSRFPFRGGRDALFFVLATRMLPPLAVAVPISFMYSRLGILDTRFGLILLYTCFNLSFTTWMMKAFIDEIPAAYEEAAMLDGHTRLEALLRVVLPQAAPGLAATAVFSLISAWNEYAFALTLTSTDAVTMPVRIHSLTGDTGTVPWGPLAAAATLFLVPIVFFGLMMRKHLVRGATFGAVKG